MFGASNMKHHFCLDNSCDVVKVKKVISSFVLFYDCNRKKNGSSVATYKVHWDP